MGVGIKRISIVAAAVVMTGVLVTPVVMAQGVDFSKLWSTDGMGFNRITTIMFTGTLGETNGQFWLETNHGKFQLDGGTNSVLSRLVGKHVTVWGTQLSDNVITLSRIVPLKDEDNSVNNDVNITTVTENNEDSDNSSIKRSVKINQSSDNSSKTNEQSVVTNSSDVIIENNSSSQRDVHINQTSSGNNNGQNVNTSNISINTSSTTVTDER